MLRHGDALPVSLIKYDSHVVILQVRRRLYDGPFEG